MKKIAGTKQQQSAFQLLLIIITAISLGGNVRAQTVSGLLEADETWSGQIVLEGDVVIPASVTLTIVPGTTVLVKPLQDTFQNGDKSRISIILDGGTILAEGTSASPVRFQSEADPGVPGDWGGVTIIEGDLTLKHFAIEHSILGLRFADADTRFSKYDVSDGTISFTQVGIWIDGEGSEAVPVVLNGMTISKIAGVPDSNPAWEGAGIYAEGRFELHDSSISETAGHGIRLDGRGSEGSLLRGSMITATSWDSIRVDSSWIDVADTTIEGSSNDGIELSSGGLTIATSEIKTSGGKGIRSSQGSRYSLFVNDCLIEGNDDDGIYIVGGGDNQTIEVKNSVIRNNSAEGIDFDPSNISGLIVGEDAFSGNTLTGNNIGFFYRDGFNRDIHLIGNHIAENEQSEVYNENNYMIHADGNSWGAALLSELENRVLNFARIRDVRDDWYAGQVLIRNWYNADATSEEARGPLQEFTYEREGISQVVSGDIDGQVVWSGNILVTGDVVINAGGTLIISPGTVVTFEPLRDTEARYWGSRSQIVLEGGGLIAEGTAESPIVFTTAGPESRPEEAWVGDWAGLKVNDGDLILKHFEIAYARFGIEFNDPDTRFNTYEISDGLIRNSRNTGVVFNSPEDRVQTVVLTRVKIQDTEKDPVWTGVYQGRGIFAESPVELLDCEILNSSQDGIYAEDRAGITLVDSRVINSGRHGISGHGTTITLNNSTISESAQYGVEVSSSGLQVISSEISNNRWAGVNANPSRGDDVSILNSVVRENAEGIRLRSGGDGTVLSILDNQIVNNRSHGLDISPSNADGLSFDNAGVAGSVITGNGGAGVFYRDGLNRRLFLSRNHIADNEDVEVRNENNWPIIASGNSWGAATLAELRSSKVNLSKIHDSRDDVTKGQVLIVDFFPDNASGGSPGAKEDFDFSQEGVTSIVSGDVSENTTWSGKILVTGDVRIRPGALLIIEPGTTVMFELLRDTTYSSSLSRSELIVAGGGLLAEGTASAPIIFTTSSPPSRPEEDYPGDWYGVRVDDGDLNLKHFEIAYSQFGLMFNDTDNRFSDIQVSDGVIRNSNRSGVWTNGEGENVQNVTVQRLRIHDIETDSNSNSSLNGDSVFVEGPLTLVDCEILRSEKEGIHMYRGSLTVDSCKIIASGTDGIFCDGGSLTILDSFITLSEDDGINVANTPVTIRNSTITGSKDWGVYLDNLGSGTGASLHGNLVSENKEGVLIESNSNNSAPVSVVSNFIINNQNEGLQLFSNSSGINFEDFEIVGNALAGNGNGFRSYYRNGNLDLLDNDIFLNRVLQLKNHNGQSLFASNNYFGDETVAEIDAGQENLSLIYDAADDNASGAVTMDAPRRSANLQKPAFKVNPEPTVTTIGGGADFYAAASGTPLLSYQWYLNDSPLLRETNSVLRVRLVTSSKLGDYYAVASNLGGGIRLA